LGRGETTPIARFFVHGCFSVTPLRARRAEAPCRETLRDAQGQAFMRDGLSNRACMGRTVTFRGPRRRMIE
jgi:hypothetical protein